MQHLEGSGTPVLYIGLRFLKDNSKKILFLYSLNGPNRRTPDCTERSLQTSPPLQPVFILIPYPRLKQYFRFEACSQNCETRLLVSSCLSVRPSALNSAPTERFSLNCILEYFSKVC